VEFFLFDRFALVEAGVDFVYGDRCVNRADVDDGAAFLSVQMLHSGERLRAVKFEHELQVLEDGELPAFLLLLLESHPLPVLSLIFAKVQNLEGLAVLNAEQALPGNMYGPAAKVTTDPAAAKLFGDGQSSAGAAK